MDAIVIVTGAAGALGHAVVAEFLAAGRPVVALNRPGARLDALGGQEGLYPAPRWPVEPRGVHTAFEAVDALPVSPDALVGLAGDSTPGALADVDEDTLDGRCDARTSTPRCDGTDRRAAIRRARQRVDRHRRVEDAGRRVPPRSCTPRKAAVAPAAIAKVIAFLGGPDGAPISGAAIPV